ncbi:hypothetical protein [Nonomuraea sp. NPDC003201]
MPYLTTGSPLQARLSLRKDRLDVDLRWRGSSGRFGSGSHGILLSTVRAVPDGKLAATALTGYTGSVTGHLTGGVPSPAR